MNEGIEKAFNLMNSRIRSTHVHDNGGKEDSHLFPFVLEEGGIDWKDAMRLLASREAQYPLLLELTEQPGMAHPLDSVKEVFDRLENQ
jgi:sugar phosphate isomerase/epimerase